MLQIIRFADCGGGLERAVPGSWGVPASLRSWLPLLQPPPNADPAPEPVCSGAKALPSEGGNGGSAPCMRCRSATRAGEAAREPAALGSREAPSTRRPWSQEETFVVSAHPRASASRERPTASTGSSQNENRERKAHSRPGARRHEGGPGESSRRIPSRRGRRPASPLQTSPISIPHT